MGLSAAFLEDGLRWTGILQPRISVTRLYNKDPKPLREDLPKIFKLIAAGKIDALVTLTLPYWRHVRLWRGWQAVRCRTRSC